MSGRGGPLLVALALLSACASRPEPLPACTAATLQAAVEETLSAGGALPSVAAALPNCQAEAAGIEVAWRERVCSPEGGWRLGLAGVEDAPEACGDVDRWWREGHQLGRAFRQITARLGALDAAAGRDDLPPGSAFERVKLIRERDNIRGIAQIKGWPLPPGTQENPQP